MIKNKVPKKFQKPAHTWNLLIYLTKYVKFYPDNVKEAPEDKMHDVIAWPEFCREKVAPQIVNSIMKLRSLLPDEFLADSNPDKKKVVKIRHAEKKQIADLAVDFSIMLFAKGYKGYRAALSDFVDVVLGEQHPSICPQRPGHRETAGDPGCGAVAVRGD